METGRNPRWTNWVILGDLLVLALVTVFGFASHDELDTAGSRMLTTFIPLVVSWLMVAPFLGAYDPSRMASPTQLWRPFYAMVLAGPLAAFLRGVMLGNTPILPVFVVVIGGISALALLAWRALVWVMVLRQ